MINGNPAKINGAMTSIAPHTNFGSINLVRLTFITGDMSVSLVQNFIDVLNIPSFIKIRSAIEVLLKY